MKGKVRFLCIIMSATILILTHNSIVNAEAKNNNPMLKDIKIDGNSIEPKFEMFTTEYVLTVEEEVEKINLEAFPDDEKAKVEIKGNTTLKSGRNEIEIQVTAEDGQAKQSYFLYITKGNRSETNANLKQINIKDAELAPNFDKDTINYAFVYPKDIEQLEIEVLPEDEEAKVEVIGNENLKEASQKIEIKVTAKDGKTIRNYYLVAKKEGMEVESPEGNEPPTEENQEEEPNNENNFAIVIVIVIAIVLALAGMMIERGKKKNEK